MKVVCTNCGCNNSDPGLAMDLTQYSCGYCKVLGKLVRIPEPPPDHAAATMAFLVIVFIILVALIC